MLSWLFNPKSLVFVRLCLHVQPSQDAWKVSGGMKCNPVIKETGRTGAAASCTLEAPQRRIRP